MANTAIWVGRLLVVLGIAGYGYGMYTGNPSLTAFIPAAFGIVLMICGHLAIAKENWRKHLMHVAVLLALIGFILPVGRLVSKFSDLTLSAAVISQILMAILCLVFVVLGVRSFAAARQS
jgi:small-conductance mechanosensitive channel